uniref:Uncharacterized protein n=1 Tax=Arundo donax TaxID=35708 RepID=A0A0A9AUA5_ARUDO
MYNKKLSDPILSGYCLIVHNHSLK